MYSSTIRGAVGVIALGAAALAAPAAAAGDHDGFIYGRVETTSGAEYEGFLRWGDEECFWDDLFHSLKEDLPHRDMVKWEDIDERDWDRKHRRDGERISLFGREIIIHDDHDDPWDLSRIFIARFGDIERIEVTGDEDADLIMKSGARIAVSGYANDVGGTVQVDDEAAGRIDLHWERIDTIEFMPAPSGADPEVWRLHGRVETDSGEFEGFIQWDKEECISSDKLDGNTRDGEMSIAMGRIRMIERRGHSSSNVELKDGRVFRLRDTNDVNRENRGIMVEDERFGRVTIPWEEFDRIVFSEPQGSGRGYNDYRPLKELRGTVHVVDGDTYRGSIVLDLDESEGWEMLNGSYRDIEFNIPLARVASITPGRRDQSTVVLRNGEELRLEDSADVGKGNIGVLIYSGSDDPVYVDWEEVESIELD